MKALAALLLLQAASFVPEPGADVRVDADTHTVTLRDGVVMTDIAPFQNGVVTAEFFMVPGRAFTGILFRAADAANGELFYFRHHQRGNPDAWQYHPRYNGHEAYQIYQGEGFGGAVDFPVGQWTTVELSVCGDAATVFIDGVQIVRMSTLMRPAVAGRVGFWALRGERVIRNVRWRPSDVGRCDGGASAASEPTTVPSAGLIPEWGVLGPFDRNDALEKVGSKFDGARKVTATHRGIADLNVIAPIVDARNTVVARAVLTAERPSTAMLDLGFSDDVSVFLNGQLLFEGSDRFRSRDYRFLGTMGFHDSIALRLKPGDNLLDIVITEVEGGWGIAGRLRDASGVMVRAAE